MHIQFIKSLLDIPYDEWQPIAKPEHFGKAARVNGSAGKTLMLILPCGHTANLDTWSITNIETDEPGAMPSIFCFGTEHKPCWHGYLLNGVLVSV
jgi:hypothetical protein